MKYWKEAAAAAIVALAASGASAATCGPATGGTKTISLSSATATTACYAYGTGNINGNEKQDPILNGKTVGNNTFTLVSDSVISGLTLLDKSDSSKDLKEGALSGTLKGGTVEGNTVKGTFKIADVSPYSSLILALKIGNSSTPSWAAFKISTVGLFDFLISPKQASTISHVNLYGIKDVAPVPLPASALLLLGGVGGLAALRRRKKA